MLFSHQSRWAKNVSYFINEDEKNNELSMGKPTAFQSLASLLEALAHAMTKK